MAKHLTKSLKGTMKKGLKNRRTKKRGMKSRKGGTNTDECPICFDEMDENAKEASNTVFITKCNHKFHRGCLSKHCETKSTCPMCRGGIKSDCKSAEMLKEDEINYIIDDILRDNTSANQDSEVKKRWSDGIKNKIKDMKYSEEYVYHYGYGGKDDDVYKQAADTAQWYINEL